MVESQNILVPLGESDEAAAFRAEDARGRRHAANRNIRPARDFEEMNALATIAIFAAILYRMWRIYGPVEIVDLDCGCLDLPPDRSGFGVIP